jgi:hypothetical protein
LGVNKAIFGDMRKEKENGKKGKIGKYKYS